MKLHLLASLWIYFSLSTLLVAKDTEEVRFRRIISLVDYVKGDYSGAVRQGEVIDHDEFTEVIDFLQLRLALFGAVLSLQLKAPNLNLF